jgi:hypothetical protein
MRLAAQDLAANATLAAAVNATSATVNATSPAAVNATRAAAVLLGYLSPGGRPDFGFRSNPLIRLTGPVRAVYAGWHTHTHTCIPGHL